MHDGGISCFAVAGGISATQMLIKCLDEAPSRGSATRRAAGRACRVQAWFLAALRCLISGAYFARGVLSDAHHSLLYFFEASPRNRPSAIFIGRIIPAQYFRSSQPGRRRNDQNHRIIGIIGLLIVALKAAADDTDMLPALPAPECRPRLRDDARRMR